MSLILTVPRGPPADMAGISGTWVGHMGHGRAIRLTLWALRVAVGPLVLWPWARTICVLLSLGFQTLSTIDSRKMKNNCRIKPLVGA